MGGVKALMMEHDELQPMYEWIEENYDINVDQENEEEWNDAVKNYHLYMDKLYEKQAYIEAVDDYDYYIHLTLMEADQKFSTEYSNLLQFVHDGKAEIPHIFYKMCFAHAVTLFEVYMQDIAKTLITNTNLFYQNYLRNSKVIAEKSYSLKEFIFEKDKLDLATNEKNLRQKTLATLSSVLFHDIHKVILTFECLLNCKLPIQKDGMNKVVHIRHDIVHRNGISSKGVKHDINKKNVLEAMASIKVFSSEIRREVSRYPGIKPAGI